MDDYGKNGMSEPTDWAMLKGESQGMAKLLRIRKSEAPAEFATLCAIEWRYPGEDQNGMPSAAARTAFDAFEDALAAIVDSQFSRLVMVTTGLNVREWAFYTSDRELFMKQFNHFMSGKARVPIKIAFFTDAAHEHWMRYRKQIAS